jgi:DNA-binding CsgD family transcriptional regulator
MTTATRPAAAAKVPEHGTPYRYKGPRNGTWEPCRCTRCTRAHTKACSLRALAHLNGQPPLHPAGPVLDHIKTLNASGMRNDLIARRAGVAASTINYVTRGVTKQMQRENALKILAVLPGDFDDTSYRPALGSMRRVRALYAIGQNSATIAATAGIDTATVSSIANGHYQQLSGRVDRAIATAYQRLRLTPGTSRNAKRIAQRNNWPSPIAWDGNIDDPTAEPDLEDPPEPFISRDELARQRREEIWLLRTASVPPEEIAARLGVTPGTVRVAITEFRTGKKKDRTKQVAS